MSTTDIDIYIINLVGTAKSELIVHIEKKEAKSNSEIYFFEYSNYTVNKTNSEQIMKI